MAVITKEKRKTKHKIVDTKTKPPQNHVTPHDWFTKETLSDPIVMRELIEKYISEEDLVGMNLKTLKSEKTDFIDQILGKKACDLLFSVERNNKKSYIYTLVEQQSSIDHSMMTRILKYVACIYDMHQKNHPDSKKLPLILPLLIYSGTRKYKAPLSLQEASEDPERAKHHFPLAAVKMIDLQKAKDADISLSHKHYLGFTFYLLKNARSKNIFECLKEIDLTIQLLKKEDRGLRLLGYGLYYIMALSNDDKKTYKVKELFNKNVSIEDQVKIMSVIDHIREQGIEQGIEQRTKEIVNKMLKKNMDVSEISSITELSVAEIEKLKKKLN